MCIRERALLADPARKRRYTREQYLRSPAEMAELFADIPAALANSVEIARRCSLPLKLGTSQLPIFPTPDGSFGRGFHPRQCRRRGWRGAWPRGWVAGSAVAGGVLRAA